MQAAQPLRLPAVFGRYVLLHCISRGGMGEIFLAKLGEIQGFEKPIVIKKILPHLAQDRDFLRRFIEEAQIAIKLTHGNIVPVYEVGMVSDEYFLALQYIEGRDLRTLLNRCRETGRRLPPDLCLYLAREIANGLAYAHRRTDEAGRPLGLVHCDISPPNVLVTYEGEVKIIDFGIAKSAMQRAQANDEIGFGKFGYMAPEQLIRGAVVDRRTDIYSTGVILYELLTGQRLFTFQPGMDLRTVAREVTAGNFLAPSEKDLKLSSRFDMLVMRALRTEKAERYHSAEDFRDAVQQHLYTMNPTISADHMAAFMRELFDEEITGDRQMLRSLSQTDVEPFRAQLSDASSHTVSYALAGGLLDQALYLTPSPVLDAPALPGLETSADGEPLPEAEPAEPPDEVVSEVTPPGTSSPTSSVTRTEVPTSRTWILAGAVAAVLVLLGGVAATLVILNGGSSPQPVAAAPEARAAARPDLALAADLSPESADAGASAASPPAAEQDAGSTADVREHLSFEPETIHKSHFKKQVRKSSRNGRTSKGTKAVSHVAEVSPASVQKKFGEVRKEYQAFTHSYGRRLDNEWQQILFANTYGSMDQGKYKRLNDMLDLLRRHMSAIRDGTN